MASSSTLHNLPTATSTASCAQGEDICPACFKKGGEKYAGAEHQKEGEPVPAPAPAKKKRAASKSGGGKAKKAKSPAK